MLGSGRKTEFKGVHVKQLFYCGEWWAGVRVSADGIVVRVMFLILIKRCALIFLRNEMER